MLVGVGNCKRSCIIANQDPMFREQLLACEKTPSERVRCSLMEEAVRYAIALLWE
ncbi:hypothetical protein QUB19_24600 [Microcoleus sp. B4-C5]|uniref:hypothetical protein n=1 Tax=unclassified Microcoleus TaxID=2642155 RepID=UPI002FD5580C